MNKLTWVLFVAYFAIFVLIGVVFYWRYLGKFLASGAAGESTQIQSSTGYIYYRQGNNLFRLDPDLTLGPNTQRVERYQSTGEVFHLNISPNGEKMAYDAKNSQGSFEIWQVDMATHTAEITANQGQNNLGDFQDFRQPKYSPGGTKLAFIASKNANETIFIKNLADGQLQELLLEANLQLSDYTWTKDSQEVIYCTSRTQNSAENGCWRQRLSQGQARKILSGEVSQIETLSPTSVIYLAKNQENTNIYVASTNGNSQKALTDLVNPNYVAFFQVDPEGNVLTYEVHNGSASNIYLSRIDGSNRIQLTENDASLSPVISPDSQAVAFFKLNDGIYIVQADKSMTQKMVNLTEITRLLVWR